MGPSTYRGFERQARHAAEAGVHEHQCRAHELLNLRGGDAAAAYALAQFPAFPASFDSCEPVLPLWHCAARGGHVCSRAGAAAARGAPVLSLARSVTAVTLSALKRLRHTTYEPVCASDNGDAPWLPRRANQCRETAGPAATRDSERRRSDALRARVNSGEASRATVSACADDWPAASRRRRWPPASSRRI